MTLLLVALLGGLGAATRFVVDGLIRGRRSRVFPLATVLINVSGSALLGLLAGASAYHSLGTTVYVVAAVGFCGGYTTFSTAMVETVRLAQQGDYRRAVANALGTLLLAVGAAALGILVMWLVA
ncbi:MAG: fluoride efflux transporter CrcB [Cellulomonas sp.]|uniref:fluoride efflux transporter CrcB n=1 Tax=Cellulomonas sp. TaxID=40001 RepID=UPI001807DD28|nr:fluoride efflux transporter CrcB [Cellulomonas sp.]NMM16285.1 fluoride efflux transporter CrcB [Cellulomonas sp.]NMM31485.1 fluoride efflux transporter CrcB [Cellulomonas sp.]